MDNVLHPLSSSKARHLALVGAFIAGFSPIPFGKTNFPSWRFWYGFRQKKHKQEEFVPKKNTCTTISHSWRYSSFPTLLRRSASDSEQRQDGPWLQLSNLEEFQGETKRKEPTQVFDWYFKEIGVGKTDQTRTSPYLSILPLNMACSRPWGDVMAHHAPAKTCLVFSSFPFTNKMFHVRRQSVLKHSHFWIYGTSFPS